MHDSGTHMETAKALPDIIKYLKENDFMIEPITEIPTFIISTKYSQFTNI